MMPAFTQLVVEAWGEARTNRVAGRVWRRVWWWMLLVAVPLAFIWYPVTQGLMWLLPRAGFTPTWPWSYTLVAPFDVLLDVHLVAPMVLVSLFYRQTFLQSLELRATPLTSQSRLWGIVLPTVAMLVQLHVVTPVLAFLFLSPKFNGTVAILFQATTVPLHKLVIAATVVPFYTLVGIRWLQLLYGGEFSWSRAAKLLAGPLLAQTLLDRLFRHWMMSQSLDWGLSKLVYNSGNGVSHIVPAIIMLAVIASVEFVFMAILIRKALREAEREIFTPETVERWELRRARR